MIHHERLRPPSHDYPADEWNVIEKGFHPEFLAQSGNDAGARQRIPRYARVPGGRRPQRRKQLPSSMGSTKPGRSYTEKKPTVSRKPARPSSA